MGILDVFKGKPITPEERKKKSINKIRTLGIVYNPNLPMVESSADVKLKSLDEICQRAIANILAIQLACDIAQGGDYEKSKAFFWNLIERYGVQDKLLKKERKLFEGGYTQQDAIDVSWTYECYWSLVWALGLIGDIEQANQICDCEKAVKLVSSCQTYDEFKDKCKLRDIEKILDMLDLYYRYHWACVEKRIRPEVPIGNLDSGVVMERRRGLEWLISEETDWNDISLDT